METPLLNKEDFFKEYPTALTNFEKANIDWKVLNDIYIDYLSIQEDLKTAANYSLNILLNLPRVHSVRSRVKDSKHLIEKIIRKRSEVPDLLVTLENYKEVFHDMIGLRAMHLFKGDWEQIHDGILNKWDVRGTPTANFREGDLEEIKKKFADKGCELKQHKFGYRSTHYIVKVPVGKLVFYAEIQVRTIYEEAWSEIDHTVRYPYFVNNPIINEFSSISNRLSGMADEMGSFIKALSVDITQNNKQIDDYKSAIEKLENTIKELKINEKEKTRISKELEDIRTHMPQKFENSYHTTNGSQLSYSTNLFEMSQMAQPFSSLSAALEMTKNAKSIINMPAMAAAVEMTKKTRTIAESPILSAAMEISRVTRTINDHPGVSVAVKIAQIAKAIKGSSVTSLASEMSKKGKRIKGNKILTTPSEIIMAEQPETIESKQPITTNQKKNKKAATKKGSLKNEKPVTPKK